MKRWLITTCFVTVILLSAWGRSIDLSGRWDVELYGDRAKHTMMLPGTTDLAGLGTPNTLTPELTKPQLTRLTRKHRFVGPATYSREINIDKSMAGKPLELFLERVMWRSRVKIDGHPLDAMQESLSTPHRYLIPDGLAEGKHKLTLEIDNSKMYEISDDELAHAYTDDTQIKWNGVLGKMYLREVPSVDVSEVQVYPDSTLRQTEIRATVMNHSGKNVKRVLTFTVVSPEGKEKSLKIDRVLNPGANVISAEVAVPGEPKPWSEFSPALYTASVKTADSDKETVFGLRDFKAKGKQLMLNGKPVFLRGSLECCVFPLTGTPPLDEAGWERVFDTAEEWGLNHLRFHSWCPPEEAFAVADRRGFYLQVELPLWSTHTKPGENGAMKNFIRNEYDRIIREYGNHPSFMLMTVGNELQSDFDWLNNMVAYMKAEDPRRLYAATTFTFEKGHGGHAEPHDDFMVTQWTDDGWVRGQGVFDVEPPTFNKDFSGSMGCLSVPLVTHEIGQYAVYPDLSEIDKYTGVLDPLNFKAVRNDLEKKGRLHKAPEYLKASGKLAAILYKEEIERAMKTPGISGYQLLSLSDFPGQGTALVGLVNAFGESKGVADPDWFKGFSSPRVPLARFDKATYWNSEPFKARIDVANYLEESNDPVKVDWSLKDASGKIIKEGALTFGNLPMGYSEGEEISVDLSGIAKPEKLTLEAKVEGAHHPNSWSVWVYPVLTSTDMETPADVVLTASIDDAVKALEKGETVIYSPAKGTLKGRDSKFVPVFWSPVHFPKEAGGMGVLCESTHPALANFPNDGHTDWQWWQPVKRSTTFDTDSLPGCTAIVEMVDNFTSNRPLALIAEALVQPSDNNKKPGKLILSGIDLISDDALKDPATAWLRESLLRYAASSDFNPKGSISTSHFLTMSARGERR